MGSPNRCAAQTEPERGRCAPRRTHPHLEFYPSMAAGLIYRQKRIVLNSRAALINKILYNRIDYHAAGSYDVCRLRTRM